MPSAATCNMGLPALSTKAEALPRSSAESITVPSGNSRLWLNWMEPSAATCSTGLPALSKMLEAFCKSAAESITVPSGSLKPPLVDSMVPAALMSPAAVSSIAWISKSPSMVRESACRLCRKLNTNRQPLANSEKANERMIKLLGGTIGNLAI